MRTQPDFCKFEGAEYSLGERANRTALFAFTVALRDVSLGLRVERGARIVVPHYVLKLLALLRARTEDSLVGSN